MNRRSRSQLHIDDLKRRGNVETRALSLLVRVLTLDAIAQLAKDLGASKTEVIVALLLEQGPGLTSASPCGTRLSGGKHIVG